MTSYEFTFDVEPVAKEAMRNAVIKGWVHKYLPKKTKQYFDEIQAQLKRQLPEGYVPLEGPLALHCVFYRKNPKKKSTGCETYPATRPDLSNYVKAIEDAFNGVVWKDDGQVVVLTATKKYTHRKIPYVFVSVAEWKPIEDCRQTYLATQGTQGSL